MELILLIRYLILVTLFFYLQSCTGAGYSSYSKGVSPKISIEQIHDPCLEANWFELSKKRTVPLSEHGTSKFLFENVEVHIRPHNDQPGVTFAGPIVPVIPVPPKAISPLTGIDYKLEPPFIISLSLEPNADPFLFDFTKPIIIIEKNDKELKVKEARFFSCNEPDKLYTPVETTIVVDEKKCLHLLFDIIPPKPKTPFTFQLNGIVKNGISVKGPKIDFIKSTDWDASIAAQ
jgi:hypothetical protein